jgi:hypothetical protein
MHVPGLGALLVWLFVWHRDRYPPVRNVLVLVTGASLIIQMFPVAPPRLLPHLGIVDTGALVGPSDYSGGAPGIDQLSAMPSLHVAWALIVAGAVVWISRSRYRWLALLYPIATILVVVVTGNHYWADAIVAVALCVLATMIVMRTRGRPAPPDPEQPEKQTQDEGGEPDHDVPVGTLPVGTLQHAFSPAGRQEPVPLRHPG